MFEKIWRFTTLKYTENSPECMDLKLFLASFLLKMVI